MVALSQNHHPSTALTLCTHQAATWSWAQTGQHWTWHEEKKCQGASQETELAFFLINGPIGNVCMFGQLLLRSTSTATVARNASLHLQAKNSVSFPFGPEPCYHDSWSAWLQPTASGAAQMQNEKLQNQIYSWESWLRNNLIYMTGVSHSGTLRR